MTDFTASNTDTSTDTGTDRNNTRTGRRSGLIALAALGLPMGALLAPSTVAASPSDPVDDRLDQPLDILLPIDILLPTDVMPWQPADVVPAAPVPPTPGDFIPVVPDDVTPMPPPLTVPVPVPPTPTDPPVPGPDDGPAITLDLPDPWEPLEPFEPIPFEPGDLVLPTDPPGPGDDDDDDDDDEPMCSEYSAAAFDISVDRYDADLIEVRLSYADLDVCDFTVWTAIAAPGALGTLADTTVGMESVAFATDSAGHYQQTFSDFELCDLEIRWAVEESLPFIIPHTDPGCDDGDAEIPGDDGDAEIPGDDGDDTPDDGDDTPDDGDDTPDDGDDTPDDGDDTPVETRPLDEDPTTPQTPGGGLPQTGTDMTAVMFAIGLMTLGAGSVIALATRRREELPTA